MTKTPPPYLIGMKSDTIWADYGYDIESLPNIFTCVIRHIESGTEWVFEVSDRRNDSVAFLNFIRKLGQYPQARMIGFNNIGYDWPMIHYLLKNFPNGFMASDANIKSQEITSTPWNSRFKHNVWPDQWVVYQVDLQRMHGFDNSARMTGLKMLEVAMNVDCVVEFDADWDANLPVERIPGLLGYNRHDVNCTVKFYHFSKELFKMRAEIGAGIGVDLLNKSDIDLGEAYFIKKLEENTPGITGTARGQTKRTTPRDQINLGELILPFVHFDTPEFQKILHHFKTSAPITKTKGVFDGLIADVHDMKYKFGTGGIHAAKSNVSFKASNSRRLVTVDVTSYYPRLATLWGLHPEHLGAAFDKEYDGLFQMRQVYKADKNTLFEIAVKLGLNAVFGKGGSPHSCMHDFNFMLGITINGQLALCMLAEKLGAIPGVEIFNVNTDGVTMAVDQEHMAQVDHVVEWWQNVTRLNLDYDDWAEFYQRDVNNYVAKETSGKIKAKGAYEWKVGTSAKNGGDQWHKNQSSKIIGRAVEEYLFNGVPVADTIFDCDNAFDFMESLKVNRTDRAVMGGVLVDYEDHQSDVDAKGNVKLRKRHTGGIDQQKQGRYYITNRGEALWKIMPPLKKLPHHFRPQAVNKGQRVLMCNDLHDFDWDNLNRDYYIDAANELIESTGHAQMHTM